MQILNQAETYCTKDEVKILLYFELEWQLPTEISNYTYLIYRRYNMVFLFQIKLTFIEGRIIRFITDLRRL